MSNDKPRYKPVEGRPDFVKDTKTGALLNTDNAALEAYHKQKAAMNKTQSRLDNIESQIEEMYSILKELLGKFK